MVYLDLKKTDLENFALMTQGARITQEAALAEENFIHQEFNLRITKVALNGVLGIFLGVLVFPRYPLIGRILSGAAIFSSTVFLSYILIERSKYQRKLNREIVKVNSIYKNVQNIILEKLKSEKGKYTYIKNRLIQLTFGMSFNKANFPGVFKEAAEEFDRHNDAFLKNLKAAIEDKEDCSLILHTWKEFKENASEYLDCKKFYDEMCQKYQV